MFENIIKYYIISKAKANMLEWIKDNKLNEIKTNYSYNPMVELCRSFSVPVVHKPGDASLHHFRHLQVLYLNGHTASAHSRYVR